MAPDIGGDVEGEVTRVEAVKYLQGALGHAVGSLTLLLGAAVLVGVGRPTFSWFAVVGAALLSANGVSIWAWDGLQAYFEPDDAADAGPDRALSAQPLSTASLVEMKAGAVMILSLVAVLVVGRLGIRYFGSRAVGVAAVVCLAGGNVVALGNATLGED